MKKLLALILAAVTATGGTTDIVITEEDIMKYIASDKETVVNYIEENLQLFVEEYNSQLEEGMEQFKATSCENMVPVYVVSTDEEGICIDFNDDNGYMIVVDDYSVIAFETQGDIDYTKELDYTYYSIYDGFLYLEDGNYIPYETNEMTEEELEQFFLEELEGSYAGQTSGTDGRIYNVASFVKDKYGSGYSLYSSNTLKNYEYVTQYGLSIYKADGGNLSEGNCSLSSCYSLMNYLQKIGKHPTLPNSSTYLTCDATKDSFYSKYSTNSDYIIDTPKKLPKLYYNIRRYAIKNYGYEVGGTNPFDIGTIIEEVGGSFGCGLTTEHIVIWTYDAQVVNEIDAGYPIIWNMANSSSYGSHTTVVTGYQTYRKTTTVLGIKMYSYVQLLKLNDNWASSARYFDFTNYGGIGSFVKVR